MRTPPKNRLNLTGNVFGRLTVLSEGERRNRKRQWYCLCKCGNTILTEQASLRGGLTTSCGCFHKETVSKTMGTHHLSTTPEYRIWLNMKARCHNPNRDFYHLYGGRGIKVCERWKDNFLAFLADMGHRPSPKHSLDRTDNSKDYSANNCKWSTSSEQGRNKRNNHMIAYGGEVLTLVEWAERIGMPSKVLRTRINRHKWTVERALTTPHVPRK